MNQAIAGRSILSALLLSSSLAFAESPSPKPSLARTSFTWNGGGADDKWTTAANWVGGVAPTGLATDALVFQGGARLTPVNDFAPGSNFGSITFNAGGFVITGNAIILNGDLSNTVGGNTLSIDLALALAPAITISPGTSLYIGGVISGGVGLSKEGTGTLSLGRTNTYAGLTAINAGVLGAAADGSLGAIGSETVVASGSTLRISTSYTIPEPVTINGTGFGGLGTLDFYIGGFNFYGPLTLGASSTITGSHAPGFASIRGGISLGSYTLTLMGPEPLGIRDNPISGSGGLVIDNDAGVGINTTNSYTGPTSIITGSLGLGADGALGTADSGTSVAAGCTLSFSNSASGDYTVPEVITINGNGYSNFGGALTFAIAHVAPSIVLASDSTIGSGAILDGDFDIGGHTLTFKGGSIVNGVISGSGGVVVNGDMTLAAANTYQGPTLIDGADVTVSSNDALGTVSNGTTIVGGGKLYFSGDVSYSTAEPVTLNGGSIYTSSGVNSFSGPIDIAADAGINCNGGSLSLNGTINNQGVTITTMQLFGSTLTLAGAITGTGHLVFNGSGVTALTGISTMTGDAVVWGVLQVNSVFNVPIALNGGTLCGYGTVGAIAEAMAARLKPGGLVPAVGILNTGNVSLGAAGGNNQQLEVRISGSTPGTTYDRLNVTGTVALNGAALDVSLGFVPSGQTFTIVSNDGGDAIAGTFNGLPEGGILTAGGYRFQVSYVGGTGNDVTLTHVPEIRWTQPSSSSGESGSNTVTAELTFASLLDVTLPLVISGTATSTADFTISPNPLIIPAGQTSGDVVITIVGDSIDEANETVVLTMGIPVNAIPGIGSIVIHTATILDNDPPPAVQWSSMAQSGAENGAPLTLTADLSVVSSFNVTVPFTLSGTATLGVDYTITASPILIPAGSPSGSITITPIDDSIYEGGKTVIVEIGTPINASPGGALLHTATLTDDEPAPPPPPGGGHSKKCGSVGVDLLALCGVLWLWRRRIIRSAGRNSSE